MSYNYISEKFPDRYVLDMPDDANALALQSGGWKFDYETLDEEGIRKSIASDGRPLFASLFFPHFKDERYSIWELGPSDGYNTAGLEFHGAKNVVAIEGNVGSFLRCLLLKNYFNLTSKFLLGDFLKYLDAQKTGPELIYASGVLYHLTDPISFLKRCSELSSDLFLWTFVYDNQLMLEHGYEKHMFAFDQTETVEFAGRSIHYHKRYYDPAMVEGEKFAGGFESFANWLTQEDLFFLLEALGYKILKTIDDGYSGIPAMNIFATRR